MVRVSNGEGNFFPLRFARARELKKAEAFASFASSISLPGYCIGAWDPPTRKTAIPADLVLCDSTAPRLPVGVAAYTSHYQEITATEKRGTRPLSFCAVFVPFHGFCDRASDECIY